MDKIKLKQALIDMEQHTISEVVHSHDEYFGENQVDFEQVVDADDQSHYHANAEISNELDRNVHEHEEHLLELTNISFAPTDEVQPGAVVTLNGRNMVVAVSKPKFQYDGKDYIGISTEAPIYKELEGKKAGEEFIFNGRKFKIEEVY